MWDNVGLEISVLFHLGTSFRIHTEVSVPIYIRLYSTENIIISAIYMYIYIVLHICDFENVDLSAMHTRNITCMCLSRDSVELSAVSHPL